MIIEQCFSENLLKTKHILAISCDSTTSKILIPAYMIMNDSAIQDFFFQITVIFLYANF